MFGANAAHTARVPSVAGKLAGQRWRIDNLLAANAPAIGADGSVYIVNIGGADARIVKLVSAFTDAGLPAIEWARGLGGRSRATPAVAANGNVFVTSDKGLTAISSNGAVFFELPVGGDSSPVLGLDGTVYVMDEALHAVDPAGFVRWSYPLGRRVGRKHEAVALDEKGVVYAVRDGLHAVSPSGVRLWRNDAIDGSLAPPPVIYGDEIYVASGLDLVAVSLSTHGIVWRAKVSGGLGASPAVSAGGELYYVCGTALCITQSGNGLGDPEPSRVHIERPLQPAIDGDDRVLVTDGIEESRQVVLVRRQAILASDFSSPNVPVVGISIAADGTVLAGTDSLKAFKP